MGCRGRACRQASQSGWTPRVVTPGYGAASRIVLARHPEAIRAAYARARARVRRVRGFQQSSGSSSSNAVSDVTVVPLPSIAEPIRRSVHPRRRRHGVDDATTHGHERAPATHWCRALAAGSIQRHARDCRERCHHVTPGHQHAVVATTLDRKTPANDSTCRAGAPVAGYALVHNAFTWPASSRRE